ncbi:MAG: HD domain-containing protein [Chloroflexi bacterium]|nr:HD domain-containing protein [Chloroflexota bacterium]
MSDGDVPAGTAETRALRARMAAEVPDFMIAHIDRVVAAAEPLARRHGADVGRTLLAAQGHDLLRALTDEEWLARAEARGLELLPVERERPVLLHGPLGALELRERFGIEDELVLHAIHWHTPGHPEFGPEAWAMFVADKIEPAKLARRPELQRVIDLAEDSLEAAALAYLELEAERSVREGFTLHPQAIETREALAATLSRR